jgi:hypothetical protein
MSGTAGSRGLRAAAVAAVAGAVAAVGLAAGGGGGGPAPAAAVEGTSTVTLGKDRPKPPRGTRREVVVPDVVGLDHQLAQDTMQAAGLLRLTEQDASGEDRLLLWDRNWTVVEQWPLPGARVSRSQVVMLSSVKDDELGLPGNPPGWPTVARPG